MAILRERQTWKRDRPTRATERVDRLTPEQASNVLAAMRVLKVRAGSWRAVARSLGMTAKNLEQMTGPRSKRPPSAGMALRVAAAAGVPVEDVLSGAWPPEGACPMCGR